jgi:hypothetical protein
VQHDAPIVAAGPQCTGPQVLDDQSLTERSKYNTAKNTWEETLMRRHVNVIFPISRIFERENVAERLQDKQ